MEKEESFEKLGVLIDELENLVCALEFPLPIEMHIDQIKKLLPEKVAKFKEVYIEITGENPWE